MRTFALVAILALPQAAGAVSVTLAWDANVESDLAGYKLYYDTDVSGAPYDGTGANEGPSPIDVPLASLTDATNPTLELTGLDTCTHLFFAVTAYNTANLESAFSGEVTTTLVGHPVVTVTSPAPNTLHVVWDPLAVDDAGAASAFLLHYDTHSGPPYAGSGAVEGDSAVDVSAASTTAPSFDLHGLAPATYFVAVEAQCTDGTSSLSTEHSATVSDTAAGEGEGEGDVGEGEGEGEGEGDVGEGEGEGEGDAGGREGEGEGEVAPSCGCGSTTSTVPLAAGLLALAWARRRGRHR